MSATVVDRVAYQIYFVVFHIDNFKPDCLNLRKNHVKRDKWRYFVLQRKVEG